MRKTLAALLAAAMLISMAACAGNNQSGGASSAPSASSATQSGAETAPALSGTMNVVCTNESYMALFDLFTAETGVKVELLSMSSGEVLSKIEAEGGNSTADLWFGGGIDAFMDAKGRGYLAQMDFAALSSIAAQYRDSEGYWVSKGLTIAGFVVNDDLAADLELPHPNSWSDLTNPIYRGEILMSNPAISGTNYAVVNAMLQKLGEEDGWAFWEAVNENIDYYSRRGSDPINKTAAGEVAIGITYIDRIAEGLADEQGLTIIYPDDGIPYMPDGVAVFANSPNQAAALAFVEWLFSNDENLVTLADIDGKDSIKAIVPGLEGVELAFDTDTLIEVDLSLYGSQRTALLERWNTMMGDKAEEA